LAKDLQRTTIDAGQRARLKLLKSVASGKRLMILDWLKDPRGHFPEQVDGDLVTDGVCGLFIAQKLGISQPTAHRHLKELSDAGLIEGKRIKQWTFYKRHEAEIAKLARLLASI
jgi:DNA-binding transcriptional ArsR family regulator